METPVATTAATALAFAALASCSAPDSYPTGPSRGPAPTVSSSPASTTPIGGSGGTVSGGIASGGTTASNQPAGGAALGGGSGGVPTTGGGASAGADSPWCKVKAILGKNCVACHTTPLAGGAPFPLTSYAELTADHPTKPGKKIYERVDVRVHADQSQAEGLGVMPPGNQLAAADLAAIDDWVKAGAPAGDNPTCATPDGAAAPSGSAMDQVEWPLRECDAVYKIFAHGAGGINTPAIAPAGQESHPQVGWDAPWGDEQVQAIAFKSITDNRAVLHHWILNGSPGGFLTGWAPGEDGIKKMRDDVGMLMPTGKGSLTLDMHYFNTSGTKDELDQSGVEVCVVKKEHFRKNNAAITMSLSQLLINIPPNSKYEAKASCAVSSSEPVTLLSASPHAHKLAVRMLFSVVKKDGSTITMYDKPFAFGEQKSYALDPPVVVEKGDVINTSCFYQNTTSQTVRFGESTNDEMCFNFALYYPANSLKCGFGF